MSNVIDAEQSGWKSAQVFGDRGEKDDITEADIISAVQFDETGDFLATGDKGGRVVLFERASTNDESGVPKRKSQCEYRFFTEFQSHESEFDYLRSLEIEEKINKIKWCPRTGGSHFLLSTNDKTIKLWRVFEKQLKVVTENNHSKALFSAQNPPPPQPPQPSQPNGTDSAIPSPNPTEPLFRIPKLSYHDTIFAATPRKIYANAHAYHINSISVNSDGETYMSADDLRINLWHLSRSDTSFNILDIKPANMEELTEVITAAEFHPISCNMFCYSSSKGTVKLADMRDSALCERPFKVFEEPEDPSSKSFFSEIISSVSDVKFSKDGRYILSRDYLNLRIFDINMDSRPVHTIPVHDNLRSKLCDLYEGDHIFDKFECCFSGNGEQVITGTYSNYFHIYDKEGKTDIPLQADRSAFTSKKVPKRPLGKKQDWENLDYNRKILHLSWHPKEDTVAIAATNNLFLMSRQN